MSNITIFEFALNLAIKYQARVSRIEPVQEERTIMWAERSENCLTRVPSWSKRVQKNLVFFMLRLWPDLINIYFLSIERFNRENTRLLVRDKDPSYIYHSTIRATPAPIHIIPSFTYIKKHQHTSPYPSIFLIQTFKHYHRSKPEILRLCGILPFSDWLRICWIWSV